MTNNLLNCTNCTNANCPVWIGDNLRAAQSGLKRTHHISAVVDSVGCFFHNNARAYLMRDTLNELEQLYQIALKDNDIPRYSSYDRAIVLIKNGVMKT